MVDKESTDKLKRMVNQLIQTEEEVIDLTEKAINKAENVTVRYLLQGIQHDSRKHADFGRAALEILDFKRVVGAKERKEVWDLLKKHIPGSSPGSRKGGKAGHWSVRPIHPLPQICALPAVSAPV